MLLAIGPAAAGAETIAVDTTYDELNGDGDCSLREAVQAANTNAAVSGCLGGDPGEDTVDLAGFYALLGSDGDDTNQEGDLDVTESLAIQDGAIDAGFGDRAIDVLDGADPVSLTLTQVSLINGKADGDGGAIRSAAADSVLTLDGGALIENRSGDDGGAVFARGALTITNSSIDDLALINSNQAQGNGGAIAARGPLTIDSTQFSGNVADALGGTIDSTGAVSITGGTCICDGMASYGGGIAHRSEQPLTISASGLLDNRAIHDGETDTGGKGAALFTTAPGPVSMTNVGVSDNRGGTPGSTLTHSGFGGAIHMDAGAPLTLTESHVERNSGFNGGAIFTPGDLTATDTDFNYNKGGKFGGAIMVSTASTGVRIEIEGGQFEGNESGVQTLDPGGAIYAQSVSESGEGGPAVEVRSATFRRNVSNGLDGGAISAADGSAVSVSDSTFVGNVGRAGGALDVFAGASLEVLNSTLVGNRAFANPSTPIGPLPGVGGAISVEPDSGAVSVTHSTIAHNSAEDDGGGIGTEPGESAEVTIRSSILAFNRADGPRPSNCGTDISVTSAGRNIESHDTCGFAAGAPGFDLIDASPMLTPLSDNGGSTETMGLYPGSPALDRIPLAACPLPAFDQRGISRPQGAGCDTGAVEGTVTGPKATCAGLPVTIDVPGVEPWWGERVVVNGTPGPDIVAGRSLGDYVDGADGRDALCGRSGSDRLLGGAGEDRLSGSGENDTLLGAGGKDMLAGGDGDDVLKGGRGRDELRGGPGDDWLFGGAEDEMIGGGGRDRVLAHRPRISSKIDIHLRTVPGHIGDLDYVYHGRVRSERAACESNRTVKLFNEHMKRSIGTVSTDENGGWKLRYDGFYPGDTYAAVARAVTDRFVCEPARSDPISEPGP
jgi:CSLREA domain-containing protein